jgi:carboxymethylenebutenolidase
MASREIVISESAGGRFTGYLSLPPSKKGPALLLLQEVYGVNADVKAIADHLAAAGYVVLAPDLLWRKGERLVFEYAQRDQAAAVLAELGGIDGVLPDLAPALEALKKLPEIDGGRTGVVGLGFGGVLAYQAVVRDLIHVEAAVAYFPGRLDLTQAGKIKQPWLFHFGEHDAVVQPRNLATLTTNAFATNKDVQVVIHEGVLHGFAIPGRKEFDAIASRQATIKTLDFLSRTVGWRTQI